MIDRMLRSFATLVVLSAFSLIASAQRPTTAAKLEGATFPPEQIDAGRKLFVQSCAFCHGRDATGGESGPNLTRSNVVSADKNGDEIGKVVKNGRPPMMPKFNFDDQQIGNLAAFIHTRAATANSPEALRRKITLADLLTGNAERGEEFFNGKGHCSSCHSATGDLAGIAKRYDDPMKLETVMLYPPKAAATVTVTLRSGESVSGSLMHIDEFVVSLRDAQGWQRSWPLSEVTVKIDAPADAHLKLLPQYSDADVHNLFAYIQTLK